MIFAKKIYQDKNEKVIINNIGCKLTSFEQLPYNETSKESNKQGDEISPGCCSQCLYGFVPMRYVKD
jgi:hypothetical protein